MKFLLTFFLLFSLGKSLQFNVLGDFGGQSHSPFTTEIQKETAKALVHTPTDFFVAVGDNFYETGVTNVNSHRFHDTFEAVYSDQRLKKPWYIIAGNHDHLGNIEAEIEYSRSSKSSGRWRFPSLYYNITTPTLDLVFLDTVIFTDEQLKWLVSHFQNTESVTTRIVFGHYPVWSVGMHGPTPHLIKYLKPVLEKYTVLAYFSGHDHNIQHLENNGINYFVTGNAALANEEFPHKGAVPPGSLKFAWGKSGKGAFLHVNLGSGYFNVTGVTSDLNRLFLFSKKI